MNTKTTYRTEATVEAYRIDGLKPTTLTAYICYRPALFVGAGFKGLQIGKCKLIKQK